MNNPIAAPTPPVLKPDRFWRWFAVAVFAFISIPAVIAILGLLAAIAIPNFVKARNMAQAHQHAATNSILATNVPSASAETWSPTFAPGEKVDLQKILNDAKTLMEQGDYEGALQRQIWYFNHALEYDQGQTGVRLSFALSQWVELGRRYPKAKAALVEIRDQDTRALMEGRGYANLFTDVQAINHELQDEAATYELFKAIREKDPKLADQCYFWVENLLVAKGEYQWCYDHMGDPQFRFDSIRRGFEMETANQKRMTETQQRTRQMIADMNQKRGLTNLPAFSPPDTSVMIKKFAENRFIGSVRQLVEILVATGHTADAEKIQTQALAVLDDSRLKSAVSDAEQKIGGKSSAVAPKMAFGPVVERVLPCEMPLRSISGINLESGRVETVSFETNSIPTGSPTGEEYFEKMGVDMIAIGDPKLMPQSSGLNCKFGTFALPLETSDWDDAPASVVLAHATNLPSMQEPVKNTPEFAKMTVLLISEDGVLPKTFIFHTRAGNSGILQITGFTENPRGVQLRYKLVQNGNGYGPKYAAMIAVRDWLALVDTGAFGQSWETAADSFHDAMAKNDWVSLLEKVRQPLGSVISRQVISTHSSSALPGMTNGSYFVAQFETTFAAEMHAVETVTFGLEKDGQWKAVRYLIRPRTAEQTAVVKAAETWLAEVDAGNYAASWTDAAEYFQGAITQDKWVAALESVRKPLGELKIRTVDSAVTETQLPGTPDGKYVVMQFHTSFANMNRATETVTFSLEKDGQWKSVGYLIK